MGAALRLPPVAAAELGLLGLAALVAWILVPGVAAAELTGGAALLAAARAFALARRPDSLRVPLLLPAALFAALLGLVVQAGSAGAGALVDFGQGILIGCAAAALVIAARADPAELARRAQPLLLALVVGVFAALAALGSGPGESGARVNLGPIQPIEAVKPALVGFLAVYLGGRAAKLRWQRERILGLRWPRPRLLFPAVLALVGTFAGLFAVGDLGPTLILAVVFLGMFYLASRSSGWALVGLATLAAAVAVVAIWPELTGAGRVATRMAMWRDPWLNGLSHGHQVGEGLWAIAAGGFSGQGIGQVHTPLLPAGLTDLALATLGEELGFAGLAAYLALVGAIALSGLHIAARNRTPERVLLAGGLSLVLIAQLVVIAGGTFRLLPLTGVVVPLLSSGKSSMVAFLFMVGLLARLSQGARERVASAELDELRAAVLPVGLASAGALAVTLAAALWFAVLSSDAVSARPIVVRLADGTVVARHNPRLLALAGAIRRGSLEDRDGRPLARDRRPGEREYPLGAAMGTLIGAHPARILLPAWSLERRLDRRLRGYGEREDAPRYADYGGAGAAHMPSPDLSRFAPLLHLPASERARAVAAIDAGLADRSVRLTIDARLQLEVSRLLAARVADSGAPAAAAVVLAVDTGQVLARAQVPDLDPGHPEWQDGLVDPAAARRFYGVYGAGADATGALGMFQAGSVGKLVTALAAARRGWSVSGAGCAAHTDMVFRCAERDGQGPLFIAPGWTAPIHDHPRDPTHGAIDAVEALAVSCNVYFGQLGLALGPDPFRDLVAAGLELGYRGDRIPFDPGARGSRQLASTAFGQGAIAMNVLQVARLAAAVGGGGVYRRCPGTLELAAPCPEARLIDDPALLAPILAGMRRVMTDGTGKRLAAIDGARLYGKTGTADSPRFRGEPDLGRRSLAPHSWFALLVEPDSAPECAPVVAGRIAIAVVVPRGGTGASSAGPTAVDIARAVVRLGYLPGGR